MQPSVTEHLKNSEEKSTFFKLLLAVGTLNCYNTPHLKTSCQSCFEGMRGIVAAQIVQVKHRYIEVLNLNNIKKV